MITLGVDEVGRGSIAGPLVVGAVALDLDIDGLKDSKLLSEASRIQLAKVIYERAKFIGLGWVSSLELDKIGLTKSLTLAAKRSLRLLKFTVDRVVLDGNYNYLPISLVTETIVGGDNIEPSISAASIVAKVARDAYMTDIAKKFPEFNFDKNAGYGTSKHIMAVKRFGICEQHRRSFEPVKSNLSRIYRTP